jgi:hypothetical protein
VFELNSLCFNHIWSFPNMHGDQCNPVACGLLHQLEQVCATQSRPASQSQRTQVRLLSLACGKAYGWVVALSHTGCIVNDIVINLGN